MENRPYQRKGVSSNTQAGKDFENKILFFLENNGITVENQTKVEIGINAKKEHAFDFGNNSILVECKSQTWTETGNAPSAKIKNWSDAMFSFYLAPKKYKKLFFVEMSFNQKYCKTLLEYFIDHYFYLIPSDVILIDYYTENKSYCQLLWIEKKCLFHQAAFFSSPSTKIIFLATSSSCLNPLSRRQFFSA